MSTRFTLKGLADGELIVNGVDMMPARVRSVTIHWTVGEIPRISIECWADDLSVEFEDAEVVVTTVEKRPTSRARGQVNDS